MAKLTLEIRKNLKKLLKGLDAAAAGGFERCSAASTNPAIDNKTAIACQRTSIEEEQSLTLVNKLHISTRWHS